MFYPQLFIIGNTSENACINSSTFSLLKIRGGLIFNTLLFLPSLLTIAPLSLTKVMIFAAVSLSSYFDYFDFTMSIPWNRPTPLISPTKSNFINYSSLDRRYLPVSLAFSWSFWYSITSKTALVAVTAKGLPPYVLKY